MFELKCFYPSIILHYILHTNEHTLIQSIFKKTITSKSNEIKRRTGKILMLTTWSIDFINANNSYCGIFGISFPKYMFYPPSTKKFIRRKVITNYSTTVNITPSVNFQSLDVFGFSQFFWVVSSLLINLSRFSSLCVGERTRLMVQNQNKGKSDGKIGLRFQVYFIFLFQVGL